MSPALLLVLGLSLLTSKSSGLKCYTCSGVNRGDQTCIDDPEHFPGVNQVDCYLGGEDWCCTIVRQVYVEDKDTIVTFARSCQPKCIISGTSDFDKTEDWTSIFSITKCTTPLCNIKDGSKPLPSGGGGGDGGDGIIDGIPGENNAPTTASGHVTASLLLGITLMSILDLYWRW